MQSAISDDIIALEIRKAVEFLSHWPGVRRIWLFGSAAIGRGLDWRSDLDFAVEQATYGRAKLEFVQAQLDVAQAQEKLNLLLGLSGDDTKWKISQRQILFSLRTFYN